jgi:CubicO group peptidase (beta-lactamase class C family)
MRWYMLTMHSVAQGGAVKRVVAKMFKFVFAFAAVLGIFCAAVFRPDRAIQVATGLASHTLCSAVFVSGLDADRVYSEEIKPMVGPVSWGLRYKIDSGLRGVKTTFAGGFISRAVYHPGFGCILERDEKTDTKVDGERIVNQPIAASIVEGQTLRTALDHVFSSPRTNTKAVVVMHDGEIIAERYAPGYGINTPLHGWSLTKSVTSAFIGILVRQGLLSVEQPVAVPAWNNDPRHAITIDEMLRMTSGLAVEETGSGFDPESRMLYIEPDMAAFVERANLKEKPGSRWEYTSANTLILSKLIRDAAGGHPKDVLEFAHRELFDPLGMRTVTLEFDGAGTPVGSSFMYASARDWARLGALYLDNGIVNGKRILPEGWARYSSSPTLGTRYAAGFWTNIGQKARWGMPADSYFASGILGQKIVIMPSERLVIMRSAVTFLPDGDNESMGRLVTEVIAALHQ